MLQEPWKVRGQLGCAVALFELRLMEAYFMLPGASLYAGDHAALTKLCSRTLRTAATPIAAPFDAALALSRSSLRRMLSSQDAVLGPWPAGREQLEDELRAYAGEQGCCVEEGQAVAELEAGCHRCALRHRAVYHIPGPMPWLCLDTSQGGRDARVWGLSLSTYLAACTPPSVGMCTTT